MNLNCMFKFNYSKSSSLSNTSNTSFTKFSLPDNLFSIDNYIISSNTLTALTPFAAEVYIKGILYFSANLNFFLVIFGFKSNLFATKITGTYGQYFFNIEYQFLKFSYDFFLVTSNTIIQPSAPK